MSTLQDKFKQLSKNGILSRNVDREVNNLANRLLLEWKAQAKKPEERAATWFGNQYSESLQIVRESDIREKTVSVSVKPVGKEGRGAAKIVEEGRPEYDMRRSLLESPKAKMGKSGRYTIVHFENGEKHERTEDGTKTVTEYSSKSFGQMIGNFFGRMKNLFSKSSPNKKYSDLEFRVVTMDSDGWRFPEIRGSNVREKSWKRVMTPNSKRRLQRAIKKDFVEALKGLK